MIETPVRIPAPGGEAGGVLLRPDGPGPHPGVIFYPDIWGIRAAPLQVARRIAGLGYVVLVPNVFYRAGEPPFFEAPGDWNDASVQEKIAAMRGPLTPQVQEADGAAFADFLAAQPGVTKPLGAVGVCFAGQLALRTAAARPDDVGAVVSFHGGNLFTGDASSPHRVLPRVKARLYFAHADADRSMPAAAIAGLEAALSDWAGPFESQTFTGCAHGWTTPDQKVHDPAAADRAFARLEELLATLR